MEERDGYTVQRGRVVVREALTTDTTWVGYGDDGSVRVVDHGREVWHRGAGAAWGKGEREGVTAHMEARSIAVALAQAGPARERMLARLADEDKGGVAEPG